MNLWTNIKQLIGMSFFIFFSLKGIAAEGNTINPDRPGLSTGTHTAAPNAVYVEYGYQYSFTRSGVDTATHTLPQLVLRTGITEKLEIDLVWDGWNNDREQGASSLTSSADLTVGGKYRLFESTDTNLTLLGLVNLSTGSSPSTSNNADPQLGLLWDRQITADTQAFGIIQLAQLENDGSNSFIERQFAVGLSFSNSDVLTSFVEYFAAFPTLSSEEEQHIINGGFQYLISPDIQLDISVGAGLNDATSHFISVGVAMRFE